jgi:uncharacterized protein YcbK (DUF882 family)
VISPKEKTVFVAESGLSRRDVLRFGLFSAVAASVPSRVFGAVADSVVSEHELSFYNTHTGESLKTVYWSEGEYIPEALTKINHILRDHRTGDIRAIDANLFDLLFALKKKLYSTEPFHIISGYRSPRTNSVLRKRSGGVARNSLHTVGRAIDIRLPDRNLKMLWKAARSLNAGGVGYYPGPNFIHVDVGRVRTWHG